MCENAGTDQPDRSDVARIGHLAGKRAVGFRRARRGYTPAERWIVALADGSRVFAKIGVDRMTSDSLRTEQRVYAALEGDFMPQVRAWDDGARPLLLLEDLSACRWPPPWDTADVDRVLAALARLRDADPGGVLPALSVADPDLAGSWRRVAASPARFLSLGLATAGWLRGSALLVDWNLAVLAHPDLDLAFWLPSLHAEGGPAPEEILPAAAPLAAVISGFFAERAGKPPIATAPGVRRVQRQQLRTALPWAARALGLAPLDGPAV